MRLVTPDGRVVRPVVPLTPALVVQEGEDQIVIMHVPQGSLLVPDPDAGPSPQRPYLGLRGIYPGREMDALRFLDGQTLRIGRARWQARLEGEGVLILRRKEGGEG